MGLPCDWISAFAEMTGVELCWSKSCMAPKPKRRSIENGIGVVSSGLLWAARVCSIILGMKSKSVKDEGVVLLLQVPRTNDKKALAAEQMFASLQGLLVQPSKKFFEAAVRERISLEIAVINQRIGFYVWTPTYLKEFVQEQIYAQYPNVQISEVPDYARSATNFTCGIMSELSLKTNDVLPIKTFQSFEVDPLAAITATLAKFSPDEEAWL
jgi:hypothetical protein